MSVYHDIRIVKGWRFTTDEYYQLIEQYPAWETRFLYNGGNEYLYGISLYEADEEDLVALDAGKLVMSYVDTEELYNLQTDCATAGLDINHAIFTESIKLYLYHGIFY